MVDQPRFTEADAERIGRVHFGLSCRARPLPSYVDQNFRLDAQGGMRFVLKLTSSTEPEGAAIALQHGVLERIAASVDSVVVPRVVPSTEGGEVVEVVGQAGDGYHGRLLRWVDGSAWSAWARARTVRPDMLASIGALTAALGRALTGFGYPGMDRYDEWDPRQFLALRHHLDEVEGASRRRIVERVTERFAVQVAPELDRLPRSVIHADVNNDNLLLDADGALVGLIDFGDVIRTATICELAIAVAYAMLDHPDPLAAAHAVVAGHLACADLGDDERRVLPVFVAARLVTSVVFAAYHRRRAPGNEYASSNEDAAWWVLEQLDRQGQTGDGWRLEV